jgi:hypothetical protein
LISFTFSAWSEDFSDFYEQLLTINAESSQTNAGLTVFPLLALSTSAEQQAMANAYTAVARDSGYFEANAGGSALMEDTLFSIYYSNILADVNLQALTFAYRNGDLGFGSLIKVLHTPFTAYRIGGEQQASAYYIESLIGLNLSYSFFRDYYFSGIAIGANIKMAYRSIPAELYQHVGSVGATDQSAIGIMADLGALMRFNLLKAYTSRDRNFSIGLSLQNIGPYVQNEALPSQFNAGLAWSPWRFLLISGDFALPINLQNIAKSMIPGYSIGAALRFADFLTINAGFQMKGGNPRFSIGSDITLENFELGLSYTLDYTTQFRIPDHLGIELRFNLGDEGRKALQNKVDTLYIDALVALSKGDYLKVISLCEAALALDPGYSPAIETKKLAQKSQELIDKIEAIRLDEAPLDEVETD